MDMITNNRLNEVFRVLGLNIVANDLEAFVNDCLELKVSPATLLDTWIHNGEVMLDLGTPLQLQATLYRYLAEVINEQYLKKGNAKIEVRELGKNEFGFFVLIGIGPYNLTAVRRFLKGPAEGLAHSLPKYENAPSVELIRAFMLKHWWGKVD